ncbi:hypothetical protein SB85_04295 [Xanthomonas sacchari]|nr:hypothetical protein SB85_04295 [Xanthomonas sacchari]
MLKNFSLSPTKNALEVAQRIPRFNPLSLLISQNLLMRLIQCDHPLAIQPIQTRILIVELFSIAIKQRRCLRFRSFDALFVGRTQMNPKCQVCSLFLIRIIQCFIKQLIVFTSDFLLMGISHTANSSIKAT